MVPCLLQVVPTTSSAAPATFDPVPSTQFGDPSVYGMVVTDGQGTFHSVVREDSPQQTVVHRRSRDGGATWQVLGRWAGDAGGAQRPWIAVDGRSVIVGFVGSFDVGNGTYSEAPYIVTSTDAGESWTAPRRLGSQAFEVRVAVDANRFWVAWQTTGRMHLRGYLTNGTTFVSTSYAASGAPHLVAADGAMGLVTDKVLVTAEGTTLYQPQTLGAADVALAARSIRKSSVAARDGWVHVAVQHGAEGDRRIGVASVRVFGGGVIGAPVDVMPVSATGPLADQAPFPYDAAITATRGTVALAVAGSDGATRVATSADHGSTFSPPVVVAASNSADPPDVEIGAATVPDDVPLARFDWSVPERFVDGDGDGEPDPVTDAMVVAERGTVQVRLDGRASLAPTGGSIANCFWAVDDQPVDVGPGCRTTIEVADGATVDVRLVVETADGRQATQVQKVTPRDLLVVSIGDSVASGEGNPYGFADWDDAACHRSTYAGPALAARRLEAADPRSSVTFVHLACSGAAVIDTDLAPGDDPDTGGLLDQYAGVDPQPGSLRPPQVDQMVDMSAGREVDALLLSTGANDARFSDVVKGCITTVACNTSDIATGFDTRLAQLPGRYDQLADALIARGVPGEQVHITDYFDPTTNDLGIADLRCVLTGSLGDPLALITQDEAAWAKDSVVGRLNQQVAAAAATHGWNLAGGIAARFLRHGYCSSDPWAVQVVESKFGQGDSSGAFHPNRAGHRVYGDALFRTLSSRLLLPAPSNAPDAAAGPASLGDLMVLTSSDDRILSTAVSLTGGAPAAVGTRLIDRVALGEGYVARSGPPAVDRGVAVGLWHQIDVAGGGFRPVVRATRLGVRPNVAVREVDVVQAPSDATTMVADRPALVRAVLDATVAARTTIDVTTTVTAWDDAGEASTLLERTEAVAVDPGQNVVLLPRAETFTAPDGSRVQARVEVNDPVGATPADEFDDVFQSGEVTSRQTRPLRLLVGTTAVKRGGVGCQDASGASERMVAFAREAMPIDAAGIEAELFCGLDIATPTTEPAAVNLMLELEEIALYTGYDAVVVLVPGGVLQKATKGAVGIAARGVRSVVLEVSAPNFTLAHELSHMFGRGHSEPAESTEGVLVSRRARRAGTDWMAPVAPDKGWTAPVVWDRLSRLIGGPAAAPAPVDPAGAGVWVRGTAVQAEAGDWVIEPGSWVPADTGRTGPPLTDGDLDDLELERMLARPVDANGSPTAGPTKVPMAGVEGLYPAGATSGGGIGFTFGEFVALPAGTAAVQVLLDGVVVETIAVDAAPTVAVAAPAAGVQVARGAPLGVTWTASDPDGDPLTFELMISDDDGATWQPLASALTGTSHTVALPEDVGGDAVRVKVIASDGSRFAEATSDRFGAEPSALGTERVVFIRRTNVDFVTDVDVYTMAPDGSGPAEVPLPETFGPIPGQCGDQPCPAEPVDPRWAPGGGIVFGSNFTTAEDAARFGGLSGGVFSVQPDGSGLTRLTPHYRDTSWWGADQFGGTLGQSGAECPVVSADGQSLAWIGRQAFQPLTVWVSRRSGSQWLPPTPVFAAGSQPSLGLTAGHPALTTPPFVGLGPEFHFNEGRVCPAWSPDGTRLALVGRMQSTSRIADGTEQLFDEWVALTVRADGTDARVVSPPGVFLTKIAPYAGKQQPTEGVVSVAWRNNTTLTAGKGFLDMAAYVPSSGLFLGLTYFGIFDLDIPSATWTRLTPQPDLTKSERPASIGLSPGGQVYGRNSYAAAPSTVTTNGWTMGIVDAATGATEPVWVDLPQASFSANRYYGWDWAVASAGGPAAPQVGFDPDDAPPPGEEPDTADVTEVTPPGPPAADADAEAPVPAEDVVDPGTVTVIAGRTTRLDLRATGPVVGFGVLPPPGGEVDLVVVGDTVEITARPGFVGPTSFEAWALGNLAGARRIAVEVVAPPVPGTGDDTVTVRRGVEEVIDPADLLANDDDGLEIVAVSSPDAIAWLDRDDKVRILLPDAVAAAAAPALQQPTFTYTVADADGILGSARVSVLAAGQPTSTTTTPSPPTPTTAPAGGATTTAPPVASPQAPGATAPATTAAPSGAPDAGSGGAGGDDLAFTGADPLVLVVLSGLALVVGLSAVAASRRLRLR